MNTAAVVRVAPVVACSWCQTANKVEMGGKTFCWHCWHRADVARDVCDCAACIELRAAVGALLKTRAR